MEKIFDGQCKDCEFGRLREDQKPSYIACQLGGIREPNQTCNLTLFPVEDQEPDYKAMWEGIKRFISKKEDLPQGRWFWKDMMAELKRLEAKHAPQGDQGVKKEGK